MRLMRSGRGGAITKGWHDDRFRGGRERLNIADEREERDGAKESEKVERTREDNTGKRRGSRGG
jgi:hypothetical protein